MDILGLITEYNPFHNGHLYHLNTSKRITDATHTVAVMSGNFLQRGEPAILHKWERAKMAVRSGVDLVIELPTLYACSTAELFAYGAVSLLDSLEAVNYISFGSEIGDIGLLSKIADILAKPPPHFSIILKNYVNLGFTFPVARSKAMVEYLKKTEHCNIDELVLIDDIMKSSNNILGIEYLKAIKQLDSTIVPRTVSRKMTCYSDKKISDIPIASATAIRKHIFSGKPLSDISHVIPNSTFNILLSNIKAGLAPISDTDFERSVFTILRRSNPGNIRNVFDVVEGLENKIYRCAARMDTLEGLHDCIKSKRYTTTRLQRILTHILLNISKDDISYCNDNGGPQYARILAFNTKGREILRVLKTTSSIPIISNLKYYRPQNKAAHRMLNIDIRATNIYSLAFKNRSAIKEPLDYTTKPHYENI
ncbi:MAG: nucleotidyltransferase [Natronincolaceae bacterium]|jgi:predicted nucleotidyltransferase